MSSKTRLLFTAIISYVWLFYSTADAKVNFELHLGDAISELVIGDSGKVGYITQHTINGQIFVIDLEHGNIITKIAVGNRPFKPFLDQKRNKLYVVNRENSSITVVSTLNNKVINNIDINYRPDAGFIVTRDYSKLYIPHNHEGKISVIDLDKGLLFKTLEVGKRIEGKLILSPTEDKLYITYSDGKIAGITFE